MIVTAAGVKAVYSRAVYVLAKAIFCFFAYSVMFALWYSLPQDNIVGVSGCLVESSNVLCAHYGLNVSNTNDLNLASLEIDTFLCIPTQFR